MIWTRGLHIHTFSQSVVPARLLSSLQCYKSTQRQVTVSSVVRDSTGSKSRSSPTSNHTYPRPVSCHVSRCINTKSNPLLHSSYREACPTTRSTHVAMRVITHNDTAQSKGDPQCPWFNPQDSSCHSWCSPLSEPNRLFLVLGGIERVATNVVIHQHPSRRWWLQRLHFSPPPLPLIPGATNEDDAHQRHTRSVQSSSCAECGFYSSLMHGLQTKLTVLRGILRVLCPAVVVASCPPSELQLADYQHPIRRITRPALIQCDWYMLFTAPLGPTTAPELLELESTWIGQACSDTWFQPCRILYRIHPCG